MAEKWIGKTAVITGASSGIGATILRDFARLGINVIGLARRSEQIEALIENLGETKGEAYAFKCDVSNPQSVNDAFEWIEEKFGVVHILVNNAGVARSVNILDEKEKALEKLNEVMDTNVRGLIQCSREAYRLMKKSEDFGYIININSIMGHTNPALGLSFNVYPASKHAVTAITETIRQELIYSDDKKVRITSISPGYVDTNMAVASGYMDPNSRDSSFLSGMPSLKSDDISNSILFLLGTPYAVNVTELTIRPVGEKM